MKRKTFLAVLISTVITAILITPFSSVIAATLTDIQGHKNQTAIEFLVEHEVINGNPDGTFLPDNGINRAEILKLLFETIGFFEDEPTEQCFPDVPLGKWYAKYVCAAKERGFVQGYPDGLFRPGQNVNKAEALKLFANFLEWDLSDVSAEPLFADTEADAWYVPYLQYAKKKNIIEYEGNFYRPADDMIRGEVAEAIFRIATAPSAATGACADKTKALDIILKELVTNEENKDFLEVFMKDEILREGDSFIYVDGTGLGQERVLFQDESMWFFWIDLEPDARFMHNTKIATVNTQDCFIAEYESQLWPAVNGTEMWSTDIERATTDDIVYRGVTVSEGVTLKGVPVSSIAEPSFDSCGADPAARKRAIVVYLGKDRGIKQDAKNMHSFLCGKNYVTKVITGSNSAEVFADIETELKAIEAASHALSLNNFFFYTVSHGLKTGDLVVGEVAIGPIDVLSLDKLTSKMGEIAYTIGAAGIWSDSFTVVQDSCYSGNATPKYQAQAYIPPDREAAVGWIAASSSATQEGFAKNGTSVYTDALLECLASIIPYASLDKCLEGKTQAALSEAKKNQNPALNKLTPITSDLVPFLP